MTNFKTTIYKLITDKRTIPFNSNGTGTIETKGSAVFGTGTAFKTEMPAGSWLVVENDDELRYVERVDSDTKAFLSQGFTSDISAGATPSIIPRKDVNVVAISIQILSGLEDGEVDGEVFPNGSSMTFTKESRDKSGKRDVIQPIIVDATGTEMQVLINI